VYRACTGGGYLAGCIQGGVYTGRNTHPGYREGIYTTVLRSPGRLGEPLLDILNGPGRLGELLLDILPFWEAGRASFNIFLTVLGGWRASFNTVPLP